MRIHPTLIRPGFGVFCAGLSVLTIVEAPTSLLWLAALGVTEWGYWLPPLALLAWLPGWRHSQPARLGAWLSLAAALLLLSPLLRAALLVQGWPDGLPPFVSDAMPRSTATALPWPAPIVFADLFLGVASSDVDTRTVVYATRDDQALSLDLYRPAGATQAPGIIVIHGGSWQHGDRSDYPGLKFNSVFSPGETIGTAKLDINIESEKSTEGAVWLDNYGSEYTGEYRFWVDAALNNPTGAADRLSAQLLTSFGDAVGSSEYYALRYLRPVFGHRNIVGIDINKNSFRVGGIFADIDLVGESTSMSTSLRRKFIRSRAKNLEGYVALASKTSSTDISGTSLGEDKLTVLTLGTYFDYRDSWSGYTQATFNYRKGLPGTLGAMDENGDGNSSRTVKPGRSWASLAAARFRNSLYTSGRRCSAACGSPAPAALKMLGTSDMHTF